MTARDPLHLDRWRTHGHIRLTPAIPERLAVFALRALRAAPHQASQHLDPDDGHQLWRYAWEPGTNCEEEHPLCDLGHMLAHDLARIAPSLVMGLPLVSDQYKKGMFADPWDASSPRRAAILCQLHLVPAPWPEVWGGHLERLGTGFAPLWNTLDLFDLDAHSILRRPLLTQHVDGYTVSALLHEA